MSQFCRLIYSFFSKRFSQVILCPSLFPLLIFLNHTCTSFLLYDSHLIFRSLSEALSQLGWLPIKKEENMALGHSETGDVTFIRKETSWQWWVYTIKLKLDDTLIWLPRDTPKCMVLNTKAFSLLRRSFPYFVTTWAWLMAMIQLMGEQEQDLQ